eukprot:7382527-Prymnesium_polylepis.2
MDPWNGVSGDLRVARAIASMKANPQRRKLSLKGAMPEQEQVEAMIKESVDLLSPFAEADDGKYTKAHCDALGRNEGLFTHLRLVALDSDGDGKLSPDEYERYCAEGQQLVDAYLSFFINGGVVSALLFSIVFPMAFDMEIDGLGWDDDYGGALARPPKNRMRCSLLAGAHECAALGAKQWLGICAYLFSMLSCGMCFVMLVYTGSMYSQLSFWMPNLNCQLWYVSKVTLAFCSRASGQQHMQAEPAPIP